MDTVGIIVVVGGVLLVGFVAWFFFMGEGEFAFTCGMNMVHGKLVVEG
jgi:plastocyanin domain-containing protein